MAEQKVEQERQRNGDLKITKTKTSSGGVEQKVEKTYHRDGTTTERRSLKIPDQKKR